MSRTPTAALPVTAVLAAVLAAGCAGEPTQPPPAPSPAPANAADSLAQRVVDAAGGTAALESLPALRFDFVSERDSLEASRRSHLWDRRGGRNRLEWSTGDSLLVALFSVERVVDGVPAEGEVYLEGEPLDSATSRLRLQHAYSRFINDMYWLLAPLKVLDPGVSRSVAADSADATTEVLALSFEGVGLTPGDRYWLRVDRATGRLVAWSYVLQSGRTGTYDWDSPATMPTPTGTLTLPTRKSSRSAPTAIITPVAVARIDDASFSDPRPRLQPIR